jgi:hypothetical protein
MKHEHFEIFKVKSDFINSPEIDKFLNSGIIPKSISVDKYFDNQKLILIGYVKTTDDIGDKYSLEQRTIDVSFHGLAGIGKLIEKEASNIGGVVCQDIEYIGETVLLTFLVAK